jgi:1,4-alpha-glucan branching enzyme
MTKTASKLKLVQDDPWLEPYENYILIRQDYLKKQLSEIENEHGSIEQFATAHDYYGLNYDKKKKGWWFREWAPGAEEIHLIGDFNHWDRHSHPLKKKDNGDWELFLPDAEYKDTLVHESKYKIQVKAANGILDRLPVYVKRVVQDPQTHDFAAQVWKPEKVFRWTDKSFNPATIKAPIIYEVHPGMAGEEAKVTNFREFADDILPRISNLGYNAIQMMAVMEHPYYGSFGYHVSNFFAPSSRFGTPEDLKYLINTAHKMNIAVIMDVVHSHAVKNISEGLSEFDGTDHLYFHSGGRGYHTAWDSKLFNYGKRNVQRFLLSNIRYWLEEFHFDGFRFDGATSMMYLHHGDHVTFDHYDRYFKEGVDWDAVVYLQMANRLIHEFKPGALSIAEDMSGMPGLCRKIEEGGVEFDYRLAMGIPDYWIKILKHKSDEEWNIHEIWGVLTNRRWKEKTIAYAESHDQALVGDKTLAFWLMDKEMYFHMHVDDQNLVVDRGIALHKMIRLITISLGGEGYLNFIGNEFGHPEWVDFPREGNDWSYQYARRQWSLVDNDQLKYQFLNNFDKAMVNVIDENNVLSSEQARQLNMDDTNKTIIFERSNLIFIFNFHTHNSIPDYEFFVPEPGDYQIILNSDDPEFGGFDRVDKGLTYSTFGDESNRLRIYVTNRTAIVLKRIGNKTKGKKK